MKLLHSFQYAIEGLRTCFLTQRNFRIHIFAVIAVSVTAAFLGVSRREWVMLVLCMALVMVTEMINTVIEMLCDWLHPATHPLIKKIKDISAAAVLVAATAAIVTGALVFIPHLTA
jgi:diacylglycerol kinase